VVFSLAIFVLPFDSEHAVLCLRETYRRLPRVLLSAEMRVAAFSRFRGDSTFVDVRW
jgi:hypothetical protein